MSITTEISDSVYAKLLARSLPRPIHSEAEHARVLQNLLAMDERGLKHKDSWPILGNKGAASEVLSGRRSISKAQAKRLAEFFQVPLNLFI